MKTELKDHEQAAQDAEKLFAELGVECQMSKPVGDVKDNWPNILYNVTFSKDGRTLATEYRLGVGHVKWNRFDPGTTIASLVGITQDEETLIYTRQSKPHAVFKNKALEASAAAKIARYQKVAPKPYEVLAAICDDGVSAHSDCWDVYADNFGMDRDSIKSKAVYDYCCDMYHKVVALIGQKAVEKLAELHRQF